MENLNIILPKHSAVFFLVAKAANSSIKAAIKQMQGRADDPDALHKGHVFVTACQAEALEGYLKIAFVRNPWDRLVSAYHQKILGTGRSSLPNLPGIKRGMGFDGFVRAACALPTTTENHIRSQTMFMFCKDRFVPDQVVGIENIGAAWPKIQALIPLPDLERRNASDHPPFRQYYTPELRDLVAKRYAKDIETLGYTF